MLQYLWQWHYFSCKNGTCESHETHNLRQNNIDLIGEKWFRDALKCVREMFIYWRKRDIFSIFVPKQSSKYFTMTLLFIEKTEIWMTWNTHNTAKQYGAFRWKMSYWCNNMSTKNSKFIDKNALFFWRNSC